jgi:hypothetical protein
MMTKIIQERAMPERTDWEDAAKRLLRAEMAKRGVTYAQLVERLREIGVQEDERNLRNKASRGKFTAAFLLQCFKAIGARQVDISDV